MNRRNFLLGGAGFIAAGSLGAIVHAAARGAAAGGAQATAGLDLSAAEFHASRKFAHTAFGDIAYVERGEGPAALFLHGFPLNSYQWRGALPRLAPYRRCIAPDWLGLGYTRVADGQAVDPDAQVAMIVALMDQLGIDSADLVANDSGGAIAQLLLTRHPERVRTVLLTNCDTEFDNPPPKLVPVIELSKQGRFVDEWLAPWWQDKALARSPNGFGGMCYADPSHPDDDAIDMYFGPLLSTDKRKALTHAYAMGLERNVLEGIGPLLGKSRAPTRVLWGMADDIFDNKQAQPLADAFGQSRGLRKLDGLKLFWPEERPDVIAEEAQRLWAAWAPQRVR
ncbi:alpha/beta fold hydrolase [Lysobacter enzymogenes]|uniref:alpha/beta fold hydrolase n=1 Tax=Lysobacter enzymogenes TaxID=69 RepID=UPI001A971CAA|nr:alpha/beta hydrolase [Lysobacter enzymogenes]QQP94588.1 alpha/beta hydrolase [Lysobacter enzymogenes]